MERQLAIWTSILWVGLGAISVRPAVSQEPAITLQEALVRVQAADPSLGRLRYSAIAAGARVDEERVAYWPVITLFSAVARSAEAQKYPSIAPDGSFRLVEYGSPNSMQVGFDVAWPLFDFGKVRHSVEAARFEHQAAEARLLQHAWELTSAVRESFHAVRHYQRLDSLYARLIEESEALERISERRVRDGSALHIDVLRAQVDLQNARAQRARATAESAGHRARLAGLMGLPSNAFTLDARLTDPELPQPLDGLAPILLDVALRNRQEYRRIDLDRERQVALTALNSATGLPTVSLEATGRYLGPRSLFGADVPGISDFDGRIGVRMTFSVLGPTTARIRRRELDAIASGLVEEERALTVDLSTQIESLLHDLTSQASALASTLALLEQARANEVIRETEYRNGATSLLELTYARATRLQAEVSLEQVRYETTRLHLELENTVGAEIRTAAVAVQHETEPMP